jgi:hypothetical protein
MNDDKVPNYVRRDRLIAVIVTALWLLIVCFLALLWPRLAPIPVVNCPQTPRSVVQSPDGHYVANQVVVIGAAQSITNAVSEVPTITLQLLENCALNYAGQVPELAAPSAVGALFQRDDLNSLNVRLYQVAQGTTVTEAVNALNRSGANRNVYADPNYLTVGMLDAEACGNPNSTGGSPNSTGGSPNSTGGSPNSTGGSPGGPGLPASADTYAKQWAFEHIGLGPALQALNDAARVDYQGSRIRVGVFDTSPFAPTGAQAGASAAGGAITASEPITWVTPAFTLTVNMLPRPVQAASTLSSSSDISLVHVLTDVSDHGLFVAGMIHAVAPRSDIHLYPVLDKYGCGDLYTLVTQLHAFISQAEADKQNGSLQGAVINLSLGVLRPRASTVVTPTVAPTPTAQVTASTPAGELAQALASLPNDPVKSLLFTLHAADRLNMTVVAAAGNDSWRDEYRTMPLAPQLPAAYPFVIGVAGSNANRQRSCFSNWGDVSAPAGDGAPGSVPVVSGTEIVSVTSSCAASLETPLIGPVTITDRFPLGYAKWNGTSFATPLVSGLAALVLEAGVQQKGNWPQPGTVARAIKCGASAADGVVNVPVTLMRCLGP